MQVSAPVPMTAVTLPTVERWPVEGHDLSHAD